MPDEDASLSGSAEPSASAVDSEKPKRVMTAARKEQNRLAQKAYRQRQREQRERLRARALQWQNGGTRKLPALQPQEQRTNNDTQCAQLTLNKSPEYDIFHLIDSAGSFCCSRQDDGLGLSTTLSPTISPEDRNHAQSTALTSNYTYSIPPNSLNSCEFSLTNLARISPQSTTCSSAVSDDDGLSPDTTISSLFEFRDLERFSTAPQVLRESLKLAPNRVFAAALENALALGFNVEQLLACTGDYLSPFHQPNATPQSDPSYLMASCTNFIKSRNGGNSIPVHLRPTLAQILVPHHASIDLIPLPFFRERAIMLSLTMPETFNMLELKKDIYYRDGLMYWQPGRVEQGCKLAGAVFQPWDMRSWEAAPWFLQKWCMIFGGREHTFWKQSMWWNSLRGPEDRSAVVIT